ncbi:MAG TPA: Re/Si-specific NAD(P)(+) transhydrogenase subunit alpha [Gemmatimonadaceae bacterium]|nr:Re/Si-specific NAD(P)(+) transhydrogenase subunit alpha [Gemmatimonadaceae bacterium]
MKIAVLKESVPSEARVALVPESVGRLVKAGHALAIERGAGVRAAAPDAAYEAAGATIGADAGSTASGAELIVKVQRPTAAEAGLLPEGAAILCYLSPSNAAETLALLNQRRITAFALELVPRITRAQSMDALSSQATVAGYKAALIGANALGKFLPMLTTAAGSVPPAKTFVLGAGVAGLQAIATARRLGAVVSAFDVRPAAREQIQSLGATAIGGDVAAAEGTGGYAREQTAEEKAKTQEVLANHFKDQDLVITTAAIPGKPAPRLITRAMVESMRPGAVIVDLAAESGGNCELTRAGETVDHNGVHIIGPVNVPAMLPAHASQMLSRNVLTFVQHLSKEGAINIDLNDEITGAMAMTHDGALRNSK